MAFELNYSLEASQVDVGMVADSRITHTITGLAGEDIAPGLAVGWDDEILDSDAPMKGVARLSSSMVQEDNGTVAHKAGKALPLVSFGPVWVPVIGAVSGGNAAYAIVSGADTGKFTETAGVTTTTSPIGYFETDTSGDGQAVLFVQRFAVVEAA